MGEDESESEEGDEEEKEEEEEVMLDPCKEEGWMGEERVRTR